MAVRRKSTKNVSASQKSSRRAEPVKVTRKPAAKRTTKSTRPAQPRRQEKPHSTTLLDFFRFGESYTSLVLGIIVVIVAAILLVSFFKTRTDKTQLSDSQKGTTSISTIAQQPGKITPTAAPSVTSVPTTTQVTPTPTKVPTATPTQRLKPTSTPVPKVEKITPTQSGQRTYTIKPGDDLWSIAESQYHDGYQWVAIARANNLTDPGIINVGNKLILPKVTPTPTPQIALQNGTQTITNGAKITGSTYVIAKNDDLWDIAVRAYGDGYKWVDIARANNLSMPDIINVGNTLKIPR